MRSTVGSAVLALLTCVLAVPAGADVKPHGVFGNNMVLQRGVPVRVWGTAEPGEAVTVKLGEAQAAAQADQDGGWKVELPALQVGAALEMTVTGKNVVTFKNIVAGDVWLVVGQARMAEYLNSPAGQDLMKEADLPALRMALFSAPAAGKPRTQLEPPLQWTTSATSSRAALSAPGYAFARALHKHLNVPIGVIQVTYPNSRVISWTSTDSMMADPELAATVEAYQKPITDYNQAVEAYFKELEQWEAQHGSDPKAEPPIPNSIPDPRSNSHRPGCVFNGGIAPMGNLPITGVAFIIGDIDQNFAAQYTRVLPLLMSDWRKALGRDDLPMVYAQHPAVGTEPGQGMWAELREGERLASGGASTGMVVTTDLASGVAIGERLALAARALAYGEKVLFRGPTYQAMEAIAKGKVRLTFKPEGEALAIAGPEGSVLKGFRVAGEDKKWFPAEAQLVSSQYVAVWSDQVPAPVAVRYNWSDAPDGNLVNKEGLPASPFRSDDWPLVTANNKYRP